MITPPHSLCASCSIPVGWHRAAGQLLPLHDPALVSNPVEPQLQPTEWVAAESPSSTGRAPLVQEQEMEASPLPGAVGTGHQHRPSL